LDSNIYTQLPIAKDNDICPICGKKITNLKYVRIQLRNSKRTKFVTTKCISLYCTYCEIPYITDKTSLDIRQNNKNYRFDRFHIHEKNSAADVKDRINYSKKKGIEGERKNSMPHNLMPSENKGVVLDWKHSNDLISIDNNATLCPKCSISLSKDNILIPTKHQSERQISILICYKCEFVYVKKEQNIDILLWNNQHTRKYTYNGKGLWNISDILKKQQKDEKYRLNSQRRLDELRSVNSSIVMICIRYDKTKQWEEFVIVTEKDESDPEKNILHYTSVEARELLSAAFEKQKMRKGTLNEKDFFINTNPVFSNPNDKAMPDNCIPIEVKLRENGGFHSKNINFEPIVILIYSYKSKRYELMNATYDKNNEYPFVDVKIFRTFIRNHGKPAALFNFDKYKLSNGFDWDALEMESALRMYGYSVSKNEGLSVTERRNLLAEVIDLELLSVKQIVILLEFLLNSRTGENLATARGKWTQDIQFVKNYKMDPSRFLIASNVSK